MKNKKIQFIIIQENYEDDQEYLATDDPNELTESNDDGENISTPVKSTTIGETAH